MKKLITILSIGILILLIVQFPHTMINPGELTEGHQQLSSKCASCHMPFGGITNEKCISCHKVSDIGKDSIHKINKSITKEKVLFHNQLSSQKCTACHSDHKGLKPSLSMSNFNHEILPVPLIKNCVSCHSKPSDKLHNQLTTLCNNCHQTKGWKTSVKFNHEMILGDAGNNCASCHKKPDDTFHQQIKDNCNKCHGSNKWKPSTFDHSSYFKLDKNHNATCNTCHKNNNFSAFTCYGCHEHNESKLVREHNEEGIYNISKCTSCHRSGNEDEIMQNNDNMKSDPQEIKNMKKYIKLQTKKNNKGKENDQEED